MNTTTVPFNELVDIEGEYSGVEAIKVNNRLVWERWSVTQVEETTTIDSAESFYFVLTHPEDDTTLIDFYELARGDSAMLTIDPGVHNGYLYLYPFNNSVYTHVYKAIHLLDDYTVEVNGIPTVIAQPWVIADYSETYFLSYNPTYYENPWVWVQNPEENAYAMFRFTQKTDLNRGDNTWAIKTAVADYLLVYDTRWRDVEFVDEFATFENDKSNYLLPFIWCNEQAFPSHASRQPVTPPEASVSSVYQRVTSMDDLNGGDEVLLVGFNDKNDTYHAASLEQYNNYIGCVMIDVINNVVEIDTGIVDTFIVTKTDTSFLLYSTSRGKYITYTTSSYLNFTDDGTEFDISMGAEVDGSLIISPVSSSSTRYMAYNIANNRIAMYATSGDAVSQDNYGPIVFFKKV